MKQRTNKNEIAFTKVSLPYGWLGNMSPYKIIWHGLEYKTAEHLFQCLRFAENNDIREVVRTQSSPMYAKQRSREHSDEWLTKPGLAVNVDYTNMVLCIKLKLKQHPSLVTKLLETGNAEIIEDCTARGMKGNNLFWGGCPQQRWMVGAKQARQNLGARKNFNY